MNFSETKTGDLTGSSACPGFLFYFFYFPLCDGPLRLVRSIGILYLITPQTHFGVKKSGLVSARIFYDLHSVDFLRVEQGNACFLQGLNGFFIIIHPDNDKRLALIPADERVHILHRNVVVR